MNEYVPGCAPIDAVADRASGFELVASFAWKALLVRNAADASRRPPRRVFRLRYAACWA